MASHSTDPADRKEKLVKKRLGEFGHYPEDGSELPHNAAAPLWSSSARSFGFAVLPLDILGFDVLCCRAVRKRHFVSVLRLLAGYQGHDGNGRSHKRLPATFEIHRG